ncbi:MAG: hypothetical protein IJN98_01400 [Alistipes sp.]|nr:hypothetical protein [Alistipes sp.]
MQLNAAHLLRRFAGGWVYGMVGRGVSSYSDCGRFVQWAEKLLRCSEKPPIFAFDKSTE